MLIRELREEEKDRYNSVVHHPLQRWEWGTFRKATGLKVERLGFFQEGKIQSGLQVTFHQVPFLNRMVGYFPKGPMPDEDQLSALRQLGEKHNALFIKLEPNVGQAVSRKSGHDQIASFLLDNGAVPGRPLFTKHTFKLNLTKNEDELMADMKSKTRYNVRLAARKGVQIFENSTTEGMEQYIEILEETTDRQGFYAHGPEYFRTMWETFKETGMIKILHAVYEDTVLASWVLFVFDKTLYYPYGASRSAHRDVMASNLLMWETILLGKRLGCTSFDMWGSLGPDPNKSHPWYGFHRFKEGYGGELTSFLGTYDLVLDPPLYQVFRIGENLRWKWLRLRAKLPF